MPAIKKGSSSSGNEESAYEVEYIIDEKKKNSKEYYLVKWVGYSEDEATWEPQSHLVGCSEILLKFKMSKLNKSDLDDMTESLQRENDFEDCTEMPPLNVYQQNIDEVIGGERKEDMQALSRYTDLMIEESKELQQNQQISSIVNIFPRHSQEENISYLVQLKDSPLLKKVSSQSILKAEGGMAMLIQFYESVTLWQ